jgi:hypothetical protein
MGISFDVYCFALTPPPYKHKHTHTHTHNLSYLKTNITNITKALAWILFCLHFAFIPLAVLLTVYMGRQPISGIFLAKASLPQV